MSIYRFASQVRRDAKGNALDANGRIIGDTRRWEAETREVREAAILHCLNVLDGRAVMNTEIHSQPEIGIQWICQASEAALVLWAARELEQRHHWMAPTLRVMAMHKANASAEAVAGQRRATAQARARQVRAARATT